MQQATNNVQSTNVGNMVLGHEHLDLVENATLRGRLQAQAIPIFVCERNTKGGLTFKCPHCGRNHHHDALGGYYSKPNCFRKPSVYVNGYYLLAPSIEDRDIVPVEKLHRTNLRSFLENLKGRIVAVDYIKIGGEQRSLVGRLGVVPQKGGKNTVEALDRPYLTIYDMQAQGYRTVNLETAYRVRAIGKVFDVI